MAQKKIKSATDQRKFTIVYNDFMDSKLLDKHEKLIFIAIKRFADNNTMKAFPSLKKLHKITGISINCIRKSIEHMEQIGVLTVEHRSDDEKGNQSNLYTLWDYAEIWGIDDSSNEVEKIADEVIEAKMIAELRNKGYIITKEKELTDVPAKAHQQALKVNQHDCVNDNKTISKKSQVSERYTMDQIHQLFDYDCMIYDHAFKRDDIDTAFNIIYDILNCQKPTMRIAGEDKPTMVVISRFMKLTNESIIYAINKFNQRTDIIQNPVAYMSTILYKAPEQYDLETKNKMAYDMAHYKTY